MDSKPIHIALNALDHLPPPNYPNAILYLPLKARVSPKEAFNVLQWGLQRTFVQLPWLDGKVHTVSPTKPGVLEIRYHPVKTDGLRPHQLKFKELEDSETYEELRESAFHPAAFDDETLTWAPFLPDVTNGTDVLVAQANFIPGGCILTAAICHAASDGMGIFSVLKIWADNCRDVQLEHVPQMTQPLEISDRHLLERTCAEEGSGRSVQQIPPETWRLLGLELPGETKPPEALNGEPHPEPAPMPDPNDAQRVMNPYIFYIPPTKVTALREECMKELGMSQLSVNDVICALIWRSLLKSRTAARVSSGAKGMNGDHPVPANDIEARLDLPFDVRPYFSQSLPPNYLGNFTMINQALLPLSSLVAPSTSVGSVARTIRQVAGEVTTVSLMDAYTLVKTLRSGLKLQNLKVDGNGLMITSLLAFPIAEVCFGDTIFGKGGRPEALRTLMGAINRVFRYCVILPRKSHGGVEFVANLFNQEMDILMEDEEFGKYAMLVA